MVKPRFRKNCLFSIIKKLWILSTIDKIFWVLALYPIFLAFGPWSIGYIVEDHIGAIFAWGIFVNGAYLPGSFTYAYGFVQASLPKNINYFNFICFTFSRFSPSRFHLLSFLQTLYITGKTLEKKLFQRYFEYKGCPKMV